MIRQQNFSGRDGVSFMYHIDCVFCVESTSNMSSASGTVKKRINDILDMFIDHLEGWWDEPGLIRAKFILFRDFSCCPNAIEESIFFNVENSRSEMEAYFDGIEFKGGHGYCNALEAIALALKSDWTTGGDRRRHLVFVFSNGTVRNLGESKASMSNYPSDMPVDFTQLYGWWEGSDSTLNSAYDWRKGRLAAFAPAKDPWLKMSPWSRYWLFCSDTGAGRDDDDYMVIPDMFIGT